jgi:cell division protein FtsB
MYRDYSQWVQALEPRLAWTRLTRGQFRNLAALLLLLFAGAALVLLGRMAVIKNGYQIVELRQERDALLAQRKQNERRLRELESLDHAELVARRDLKMVDVNPNQVIHLGNNPSPSVPTRAWRALFGD